MALKEKFHTNHRLVYRDSKGTSVVIEAGRDDFEPENAAQRDSLLKSGAIRKLKSKALTAAEQRELDDAEKKAREATGNAGGGA